MSERRVNVGIKESQHRQLAAAAKVTGHKVSAFVDHAIENLLQTEIPIWLKAAKELEKQKKA